MLIAQLILLLVGLYAAIGLVFGVAFVTVGVARVDHAAREASVGFRLLILPASAALWPVCWRLWMRSTP
jgi:hypothetical protein